MDEISKSTPEKGWNLKINTKQENLYINAKSRCTKYVKGSWSGEGKISVSCKCIRVMQMYPCQRNVGDFFVQMPWLSFISIIVHIPNHSFSNTVKYNKLLIVTTVCALLNVLGYDAHIYGYSINKCGGIFKNCQFL